MKNKKWFLELPDGYRELALANLDSPDAECDSLEDAIYLGFTWDESKEGFAFWCEVYEHCQINAPLPPLSFLKKEINQNNEK